jgi:hypothetical protein
MGLSTIDIALPGAGSNNGGGGYKGIVPGNYKVKINKFELWQQPWNAHENALFLILKMETSKPSPDFEGYPIDENNPDGPKHEGLVGNIKFNTFAFKDGYNTRTNTEIVRDKAILEAILSLCTELDCVQWFKDAHGKYDTIEEWVEAFNADMPYKDKFIEVCIAGEEYLAKDGKTKRNLFFPKFEKVDGVYHNAYKSLTSTRKLITFDDSRHFKKLETTTVESFKAEDSSSEQKPFDLDAFDL